ncbi:MAG TPA: hypothetical protein VN495_02150 [Candidatus Paceibacterota bacterium]|nr:hypothetical protein [Candidatus Paceibacterota bacterium]
MPKITRKSTSNQALPCIVCEKVLENIADSCNQPDNGLEFTTPGHYGSTAFDPMNEEQLIIDICDDCLSQAGRKGLVGHTRHSSARLTRWRPDR